VITTKEMIDLALGTADGAAALMAAAGDPVVRVVGSSLGGIVAVVRAMITQLGPEKARERLEILERLSREITDADLEADDAIVLEKIRAAFRSSRS
jgi:predicted acylesterase/phospholipase RssA